MAGTTVFDYFDVKHFIPDATALSRERRAGDNAGITEAARESPAHKKAPVANQGLFLYGCRLTPACRGTA
jgi:hypothetical protein